MGCGASKKPQVADSHVQLPDTSLSRQQAVERAPENAEAADRTSKRNASNRSQNRLNNAPTEVPPSQDEGDVETVAADLDAYTDPLELERIKAETAAYIPSSEEKFLYAVLDGQVEVVKKSLSEHVSPDAVHPMWGKSAIHVATFAGQIEILRLLLPASKDIDHHDSQGMSASVLAIRKLEHNLEKVALVKKDSAARSQAQEPDVQGRSAAHRGVVRLCAGNEGCCNLEDALLLLREAGADWSKPWMRRAVKRLPQSKTRAPARDLRRHIKRGQFWTTHAEESVEDTIKVVLRRFGSIWDACADRGWFTLAEVLALYRQWGRLDEFEVGARDACSRTLLHCAADCGNAATLQLLLDEKGDARAVDHRGQTPLHYAARRGHGQATCLLLRHDPGLATVRDHSGRSALHVWRFGSPDLDALEMLSRASECGYDVLGQTAGHACAAAGTKESFAILCQHLAGFCSLQQERAAERPPPFTSWERGGWAGDPGWGREDPRGALRPPQLRARKMRRVVGGRWRERRGAEEEEATRGREGEEDSGMEVEGRGAGTAGERASGRTALEVAMAARNEGVVHWICGGEEWAFPAQGELSDAAALRRLAQQEAWKALRGIGGPWPAEPGDVLLEFLSKQGGLGDVLGGTTLVSAVCRANDVDLLRRIRRLLPEDSALIRGEEDGEAESAVAIACAAGSHAVLRELLKVGASPNVRMRGSRRELWARQVPKQQRKTKAERDASNVDDQAAREEVAEKDGALHEEDEDQGSVSDDSDETSDDDDGVEFVTSDDVSCVVDAVLRGDATTLEVLLEHAVDCSVGAVLPDGTTISALHVLLQARGAVTGDPEGRSKPSQRWVEAAKRMVDLGGVRASDTEDENAFSQLEVVTMAIRKGFREVAAAMLSANGNLTSGKSLFAAIGEGDLALVELLVRAKADVSARDEMNRSVLEVALLRKQYAVAVWLCKLAWNGASGVADSEQGAVASLVSDLMDISSAQQYLMRARRLVGVGGWRPCRRCAHLVKEKRLLRAEAACDYYEEESQWGEEEDEEEEDEEEAEEEAEEEDHVNAEKEDDEAEEEVEDTRSREQKVQCERLDAVRRDRVCLCSRAGVEQPYERLVDLWTTRDRLKESLLPWRSVATSSDQRSRKGERKARSDSAGQAVTQSTVKAAHSACAAFETAGRVHRHWQGQDRVVMTLQSAARSWWKDSMLRLESSRTARLESTAFDFDLNSLALILAATEAVLVAPRVGVEAEQPEGNLAAVTYMCLTGGQHIAIEEAVAEASQEIALLKPGDELTPLSALTHSLVVESHLGTDHHLLLDGTLQWISPFGLACLAGRLEVVEELLSLEVDCSKGAGLKSSGTLCALRLFVLGAPPIWGQLRSAMHERFAQAAVGVVRRGGGEEEDAAESGQTETPSEHVLSLAIRKGYREAVMEVLEKEEGGRDLQAVMIEAVRAADVELVDLLVSRGTKVGDSGTENSVFSVARKRRSAGMALCLSKHLEAWDSMMLLAACGCSGPCVERLEQLSKEDLELNLSKSSGDGRTLMMHAIEGGCLQVVDVILRSGASSNSAWATTEVACKHSLARRFPISPEQAESRGKFSWERNRVNARRVADFMVVRRMHPVLLAADLGVEGVLLRLLDACPESLEFDFDWVRPRNLLQICAARGLNRAVQHLLRSGKGQNTPAKPESGAEESSSAEDAAGQEVREHAEEEHSGSETSRGSSGGRSRRSSESEDWGKPIEHPPLLCSLMHFCPELLLTFEEHTAGRDFSTAVVSKHDPLQRLCYRYAAQEILYALRICDWGGFDPGRIDFIHRRRRSYWSRELGDLIRLCGDIELNTELLVALAKVDDSCSVLKWACVVGHIPAVASLAKDPVTDVPRHVQIIGNCIEAKKDAVAHLLVRHLVQTGLLESSCQTWLTESRQPAPVPTEDAALDHQSPAAVARQNYEQLLELPHLALKFRCLTSAHALIQSLAQLLDEDFSEKAFVQQQRLDFLVRIMIHGEYSIGKLWIEKGREVPSSARALFEEWLQRGDADSICWHSRRADWSALLPENNQVADSVRARNSSGMSKKPLEDTPPWEPLNLDGALLDDASLGDAAASQSDYSTTYSISFTVAQAAWLDRYRRPRRFPASKGRLHQSPLLLGSFPGTGDAANDLCVSHCSLSPHLVGQIERSIEARPRTSLDLTGNMLRSSGVSALFGSSALRAITALSLAQNGISHLGAEVLARALPPSLQNLDLDSNRIGDRGAAHMAAALPQCRNLVYFSLACNGIGNRGFSAVSAVLPKCSQLCHLGMAGNDPGNEGTQALARAAVAASNVGRLESLNAGGMQAPFRPVGNPVLVRDVANQSRFQALEYRSEDVNFVLSFLSGSTVMSVDLSGTELRDEGTGTLCTLLSTQLMDLVELSLCSVRMTCCGLERLLGPCASMSRLATLKLSGNDFRHGFSNSGKVSASQDRETLTEADLEIPGHFIATLFAKGIPLQTLALNSAGLDADDVAQFASAMDGRNACQLRELDIGGNFRSLTRRSKTNVPNLKAKYEQHLSKFVPLARVLSSERFANLEHVCIDGDVSICSLRSAADVDLRHCKYSARDSILASHVLQQNTKLESLNLSRCNKSVVSACLSQIQSTTLTHVSVGLPVFSSESVPYNELLAPHVQLLHRHGLDINADPWAENDLYLSLENSRTVTQLNKKHISTSSAKLDFRGYLGGISEWKEWFDPPQQRKAFQGTYGLEGLFSIRMAFLASVLRRCADLTTLSLANNKLEGISENKLLSERFDRFSKAIADGAPRLQDLDLSGCQLGSQQVEVLLAVNKVGTGLTSLSLSGNELTTTGLESIAIATPDIWSNLTMLDLSSNQCNSIDVLKALMEHSSVLRTLNVAKNDLNCAAVLDIVRGKRALEELDVSGNRFNAEELLSFSDTLLTCTSLRSLMVLDTAHDRPSCACVISALVQLTLLTSLNTLAVPDDIDRWSVPNQATNRDSRWEMHQLVVLAFRLSQLSEQAAASIQLSGVNKHVQLNGCGLDAIPEGIVLLTHMTALDISDNRLEKLPVSSLCSMKNLTSLSCTGNPRLVSPPPEISSQGPEQTMQFLHLAIQSGEPNTDMLFVAIGDGESGKTSVINAITSKANVSERINEDTRTVGIDIRTWTPDRNDALKVHIMDLAGQAVYSMSHQFFLVRRGIYVLVWRAREISRGTPNVAMKNLRTMVLHWMDSLQLRVPGATMVLVVTHIDCVGSEEELNLQTQYVKKTVFEKLKSLEASSRKSNVLPLKVLRGGASFRVNCLNGEGVEELRSTLVHLIHELPWYSEQIPGSFLKLRNWVSDQVSGSAGRKTWIDWRAYSAALEECGLDDFNAAIATSFLHELGTLKYFADASSVLKKSREWHPPLVYLGTLEDTVYISPHWIIDSLKGLMRHDREALLSYFSGDGIVERSKWLRRVHRLATFGIMHEELVPYMWPSDKRSEAYWIWARTQEREMMLWERNVATTAADYHRVLALLQGCDIIHRIGDDEFVAPGLLSSTQAKRVDARAYSDESCQFGHTLTYEALPPGFFERVIVRCRRLATHMDFTPTSAVFYRIFVVRGTGEDAAMVDLVIRASSRRQLREIRASITRIQSFFPGMYKAQDSEHEGMDKLEEPVQVQFVVATKSIATLQAAQQIQELVLREDVKGSLSTEDTTDAGLNVKFPTSELMWMMDTAEAKARVITKETIRRCIPAIGGLNQAVQDLQALLTGCPLLNAMVTGCPLLDMVSDSASAWVSSSQDDYNGNALLEGRGRQLLDSVGDAAWRPLLERVALAMQDFKDLRLVLEDWTRVGDRNSTQPLERIRAACHATIDTKCALGQQGESEDAFLALQTDREVSQQVPWVAVPVGQPISADVSDQMRTRRKVQAILEEIQAAWTEFQALRSAAHSVCSERQWSAKEVAEKAELLDQEVAAVLSIVRDAFTSWKEDLLLDWQELARQISDGQTNLENKEKEITEVTLQLQTRQLKLDHLRARLEPKQIRLNELTVQLQNEETQASVAKKTLIDNAKKIDSNTCAALKKLASPPFITNLLVEMIALLLREPLGPVNMFEWRGSPTFGATNLHDHKFTSKQDWFAKTVRTFPLERVTDEDIELLQPYLQSASRSDDAGSFEACARQWIADACEFHSVGNTRSMQEKRLLSAEIESSRPLEEELAKAIEVTAQEQQVKIKEFRSIQQDRVSCVAATQRYANDEALLEERVACFVQCQMLVAAEVLTFPSFSKKDLALLKEDFRAQGVDKTKWRLGVAAEAEHVGARQHEIIYGSLLDFLFTFSRFLQKLQGAWAWSLDGIPAPGTWLEALHTVYHGDAASTSGDSLAQTLKARVQAMMTFRASIVHQPGGLGQALTAALSLDETQEDAQEVDMLRRVAGVPDACHRVFQAAAKAVLAMRPPLSRHAAMEQWLDGLSNDVGDVDDLWAEGSAHGAWWSDPVMPKQGELPLNTMISNGQPQTEAGAVNTAAELGGSSHNLQNLEIVDAQERENIDAQERENLETADQALDQKSPRTAVVELLSSSSAPPSQRQLSSNLREAQARVPPSLRQLHMQMWVGGYWQSTVHWSWMPRPSALGEGIREAVSRGANPELATPGSACEEACQLLAWTLLHGAAGEVEIAINYLLDHGVSPADDVLPLHADWTAEAEAAEDRQLAQIQQENKELAEKIDMNQSAKADIEVQETEAAQKAAAVQNLRDSVEADLAAILPDLESALRSLNQLSKKDVDEVHNYVNPPRVAKLVVEALCIMLGINPVKVGDAGNEVEDYWAPGKQILGQPANFLQKLLNYDKDNIPDQLIEKIEPYIQNPDFHPERVESVSKACKAMCLWTRAMHSYHFVNKESQPKRKALAQAEANLKAVNAKLATMQSEHKEALDRMEELESQFDTSLRKMKEMQQRVKAREAGPRLVKCFDFVAAGESAAVQAAADNEDSNAPDDAAVARWRALREVVARALRVDGTYLQRLARGARREGEQASRLDHVISSAPPGSEGVQELRGKLEGVGVRSLAELEARQGEAEVAGVMAAHAEWLPGAMQRVAAETAAGGEDARVVVVCVDRHIGADLETLAVYRGHAARRRVIIPLIFPGFEITDYSHWWPASMPEMSAHALFVDCRRRAAWPGKVANELLPQVNKFLEEWRGEAVDPAAFREVLARVPCQACVRGGVEQPHLFNREETHARLEQWRLRRLAALQGQAPADGGGDGALAQSEEELLETCSQGHAVRLVDVLSKAVIYDAVPCPQCVHHGVVPPYCFNRRRCLLYFNEDNAARVGAMECSKCLAAGRPASIRILDMIAPEVFLSYNWGVFNHETKQYSTQAIVKPIQQRLESEEDVVCWFDVGGGMGAGQNLKAEMEEGIRKCTVVVVFLADSYLNSDNCKREFCHAVRMCKYLIPVLVPEGGMTDRYGSSGWTGNGASDPQWWMHAARMCQKNANPDTGHPIAWSALQHFDPIDLRGDGQALAGSAAELEIRKRIASRFHRGEHIKHKADANYALWSRVRAKVRHALARRRVGKNSALFPDISQGP